MLALFGNAGMSWQCLLLRVIQTEYAHCEPFSFRPQTDIDRTEMPQRSSLLLYAEVVLSFLSNGRHWAVKRREFITLFGGAAAAAWPLTAAGAQTERMRRVGLLMHTTPDELDAQARLAAFLQGLQAAGWEVGRNLRLDTRWSSGDPARLRKNAAELVALNSDVLLAGTGPTLPALLQASRTVPIVFAQAVDPIGSGSVKSLARPGGNATGFLQFEYELSGKWLELLKEIAPQVKRVGVVRGADTAGGVGQWAVIQAFSRAAGVELSSINTVADE